MKPINQALLQQQKPAQQSVKQRYFNLSRLAHVPTTQMFKWLATRHKTLPPAQRFPLLTSAKQPLTDAPELTWIGHSTFLIEYQDVAMLTDPVFSDWASPIPGLGPKRSTAAALTIDELPEITHVVISHNHYDHLDKPSVKALYQRFGENIQWFVPLGVRAWFKKLGIHNVVELDWWQGHTQNLVRCYFVPAQHFSGRGLHDSYHTLWGAWVIDVADFRCFFAGDTGYHECFKTVGDVFPQIDLALLPIGAYQPRELMKNMHVNPEEAVQIHLDLAAQLSVGMHWGAFQLTDEPMDEPPKLLKQAMAKYNVPQQDFLVMQHGERIAIR